MNALAEQRRKRGEAQQNDVTPFLTMPRKQLLEQLNSSTAVNRTRAATVLARDTNSLVVESLCLQLQIEKKLYCKIAISDALANMGSLSVPSLLLLLGTIGHNQEKQVPKKGFSKKSYPLPRDIVARTLCRMSADIMPKLFEFIESSKDAHSLEQAIDVIGHITYTHKLTTDSEPLLKIANEHCESSMIHYKIARCFSGFRDDQAKQFLLEKLQSTHSGFQYEGVRSLVLSGLGLPITSVGLPEEVRSFAEQLSYAKKRTP